MLSIQQIICTLALVVLASGVSAESQCHQWWVSVGQKVTSKQPLVAKLMTFKPERLNSTRLAKRLETPGQSSSVAGGQTGACGEYYDPTTVAVCLWSGNSQQNANSGWLNGRNTANCNTQIYAHANGKEVYAPVLDACPMDIPENDVDVGCPSLWATQAFLDDLGAQGQPSIKLDDWDFDPNYYKKPE